MNEANSLKPVVMPSTSFSLTWKDAQKEPPKEDCLTFRIWQVGD